MSIERRGRIRGISIEKRVRIRMRKIERIVSLKQSKKAEKINRRGRGKRLRNVQGKTIMLKRIKAKCVRMQRRLRRTTTIEELE